MLRVYRLQIRYFIPATKNNFFLSEPQNIIKWFADPLENYFDTHAPQIQNNNTQNKIDHHFVTLLPSLKKKKKKLFYLKTMM